MADGGEEGELRVDKLEEDPGANGENDPVLVPVRGVLHHEWGAQLEELGCEAPGQVVARPGLNTWQHLHACAICQTKPLIEHDLAEQT